MKDILLGEVIEEYTKQLNKAKRKKQVTKIIIGYIELVKPEGEDWELLVELLLKKDYSIFIKHILSVYASGFLVEACMKLLTFLDR